VPPEIEEPEEEEEGGWMCTFADLMSLLLTFFILLLSFANMDVIKFRDAMGSVKIAFGVQFDDTIKGLQRTTAASIVELSHKTKDSVIDLELESKQAQGAIQSLAHARMRANENIYKRLQAIVREQNLGDQVVVENTSRGVVITINGQLVFHSGSAVLREESFPLLDSIITVIEEFPYKLNIEGHTDTTQINTDKFPSNWELSAGRAIAAVRYILSSGRIDAEKLGAAGYAETRPIAQNDTPEGRQINRRVEFVFFRDDMEIKEFEEFQPEEEGEPSQTEDPEGLNAAGEEGLAAEGLPTEGPLAPAEGAQVHEEGTEAEPGSEGSDRAQPIPLEGQEGLSAAQPQSQKRGAEGENEVSTEPSAAMAAPATEAAPTGDGAKAEAVEAEAARKDGPGGRAKKKNILKPINILAPIGITPESVETPTAEGRAPSLTTPAVKGGTAPIRTTPAKQNAPAKGKEAVKSPPARTAPDVPGKFSAPTD